MGEAERRSESGVDSVESHRPSPLGLWAWDSMVIRVFDPGFLNPGPMGWDGLPSHPCARPPGATVGRLLASFGGHMLEAASKAASALLRPLGALAEAPLGRLLAGLRSAFLRGPARWVQLTHPTQIRMHRTRIDLRSKTPGQGSVRLRRDSRPCRRRRRVPTYVIVSLPKISCGTSTGGPKFRFRSASSAPLQSICSQRPRNLPTSWPGSISVSHDGHSPAYRALTVVTSL